MNIKFSNCGLLNHEEMSQLDVLITRYSNPGPMRPLDMFNLNFASAASTAGLLLTYLIVLMQFRAGESSRKCELP